MGMQPLESDIVSGQALQPLEESGSRKYCPQAYAMTLWLIGRNCLLENATILIFLRGAIVRFSFAFAGLI